MEKMFHEICENEKSMLEKARRLAKKDGRLRYVWGYKIHLVPERTGNFICIGAEDWAVVENNRWLKKEYA